VLREIKRGAMAEVLEAVLEKASGIEVRVALKKLLPEHADDSSAHLGFFDAARLLAQVGHANLVRIVEFGELDGVPFLAEELIEGEDLVGLRGRARAAGSAIPEKVALHVAAEIAHALAYVHEAKDRHGKPLGIIHRDVSPENILISWSGEVKLTDFGIAFASERREVTAAGIAKGKLAYMAPEQQRGVPLDGRADIYALGATLEWLTDEARSEDVARIIRRAMRTAKEARFPDARTMALEIGRALAQRIDTDGRTMLLDWLAPFRPDPSDKPQRADELEELFGFEIIGESPVTGVRMFATITQDPAVEGSTVRELEPISETGATTTKRVHRPDVTPPPRLPATAPQIDLRDVTAPLAAVPPIPSLPPWPGNSTPVWTAISRTLTFSSERRIRTAWIAVIFLSSVVAALSAAILVRRNEPTEIVEISRPAAVGRAPPVSVPVAAPSDDGDRVDLGDEDDPRSESAPAPRPRRSLPEPARREPRPRPGSGTAEPTRAELDALVANALDRRGLVAADVDEAVPGGAKLLADWRAARSRSGGDRAMAASALVKGIEGAEISLAVLRKKLDRIESKLRGIAEHTPTPELDRLDNRFIDLRVAMHAAKRGDESIAIAKRMSALESEIDRRAAGGTP
jgi:serine/threonine protein kinase